MAARIYFIFITLLGVGLWMQSCSPKTAPQHMHSKEEYLDHLASLSENTFKKQVQEDAECLSTIIDSASQFSFYYAIGFGFGDAGTSTQAEAAQAFALPSKDSVIQDFNHPNRQLYFEQTIALPSSVYEISAGQHLKGFQNIAPDDLKYDIQKVFVQGQAISPSELELRQADSLLIEAAYLFPLDFDTLVIPINKEEITYRDYALKIKKYQDNEVVFTAPLQLSDKVLEYRGVTADGTLVKSNSFSKFPITEIDANILEQLNRLQKSLVSGDKNTVMQALERTPGETIQHIRQLKAFHQEYLEYEKMMFEDTFEEIGYMKEWLKKYETILGVNEMQYNVTFPNNVQEVRLYVAHAYDSVSRHFTVRNLLEDRSKYSVYLDKYQKKYGIVDAEQNIIIPATYNQLDHRSDLFFMERKEGEFYTYLLDPEKKEFKTLPRGLVFNSELKANDVTYYLFADSNRNMGVLDKNLEEILPFEFDNGSLCGKTFVMDRNHRGRVYKELHGIR